MGSRTPRRWLELTAVAVALFGALLLVGMLFRHDVLFDLLESARVLREVRAREGAQVRRLGEHLEARREKELAAVQRSLEGMQATRGAFYNGIHHVALDQEGRLLVGGSEQEGLWLGVVRFLTDGRLDEDFLRNISRGFEDDSVVGNVRQLLPLEDGRILAVGSFGKPQIWRFRADNPAPVGFVLLDDYGRLDEPWIRELWKQWPENLHVIGQAIRGLGGTIQFLAQDGLYTLTLDPTPVLDPPVALVDRRPQELCSLGESELLVLSPPRLEVLLRDGQQVDRELQVPMPEGWGPKSAWRWLFCGPGGRALAVFEVEDRVPSYDMMVTHTTSRVLLFEGGRVVANRQLPHSLRPEIATYSERRDQWIVIGTLGNHYGVLHVGPERPYAVLERTLELRRVTAMVELSDGRLVIAGRQPSTASPPERRATRLFQLHPAEAVPF